MTPRKIYDLNDEWDEEYSEFEAFMARKELKNYYKAYANAGVLHQ